jgi:hypothetical protein
MSAQAHLQTTKPASFQQTATPPCQHYAPTVNKQPAQQSTSPTASTIAPMRNATRFLSTNGDANVSALCTHSQQPDIKHRQPGLFRRMKIPPHPRKKEETTRGLQLCWNAVICPSLPAKNLPALVTCARSRSFCQPAPHTPLMQFPQPLDLKPTPLQVFGNDQAA